MYIYCIYVLSIIGSVEENKSIEKTNRIERDEKKDQLLVAELEQGSLPCIEKS